MNAYPDYPSASLMPNMTEEELQALKADIQQHGLIEPILIFKGQVVDGRHRLRACRELGIGVRLLHRALEGNGGQFELNTFVPIWQ